MIRAMLYLIAAGLVWVAEGVIFAQMLSFAWWQTSLLVLVYLALAAFAIRRLVDALRAGQDQAHALPQWRYLSLAPMLVAVLGSFASLPILLVILALGKLV